MREASASVAKFERTQRAQKDAAIETIRLEANARIAALSDAADAHMAKWVGTLYGRILGGEL
jgi:hypothetical protein